MKIENLSGADTNLTGIALNANEENDGKESPENSSDTVIEEKSMDFPTGTESIDDIVKMRCKEDIDEKHFELKSLNSLIKTEEFASDDETNNDQINHINSIKEEMDIGETVIQQTDFAFMLKPMKDELETKKTFSSETTKESKPLRNNDLRSFEGDEQDPIRDENNNSVEFLLYCKSVKPNNRGRYSCRACDKDFSLVVNMKKHYNNFHVNQKIRVVCDICSKSYRYKSDLSEHIKKVHQQNNLDCGKNKAFVVAAICEYCSKTFATVKYLQRHVKTVHLKLLMKCPKCHKWYTRLNNSEKHKLVCVTTDPMSEHKCEVCHKTYTNKCSLSDHMRQIHLPRTDVVVKCVQCDKLYYSKSGLRRHIKRKHTMQNNQKTKRFTRVDPLRPFNCKRCGKTYSTKHSLNNHTKRVCNPRPPVECDVCQKTFNCDQYLNIHVKKYHSDIYSARRLKRCENCCAAYENKLMLINHIRKCMKNV